MLVLASPEAFTLPTTMRPFSRTSRAESLCVKSFRQLTILAWMARARSLRPAWAPLRLVSGNRKLLADRLHGVGMQPEFPRHAVGQADQIEPARPALPPSPRGFLGLPAEVPDEIDCASLLGEFPDGAAGFLE